MDNKKPRNIIPKKGISIVCKYILALENGHGHFLNWP